ncbi:MAG: BamA/TamA family outer membrane protein [Tannerellaceae bacterium]|nr:BamA/TamA family outer membrane protein [Tannerellaceae bacterium]
MKYKSNNIGVRIGWILLLFILLAACSTTKNLPEGEVLYTGIKKIEVTEKDNSAYGRESLNEVESALKYPPNNALLGSSSIRFPLPVGLWMYNAFVNKEGKVSRWIFKRFAAKPAFISTVNPDVRTKVAYNLLRENNYFDGYTSHEVIPDKKNDRKAKIEYTISMNHSYTYDSIWTVRMRHAMDTLIRLNKGDQLLHKGDPFNVSIMEAERNRLSKIMRNNGFYYFRPNFLVYEADTTIVPGKVWLRMVRKEGIPGQALRPYTIGNIAVRMNGFYNESPTDSIQYKDLTIHYQGKLRVRPGVLYNRIKFRPGDLYTQDKQDKTQTALSQLQVFRYAEMDFNPPDTTRRNSVLDLDIHTVYDLPLNGEFEVNLTTKSNDQTGPGAIFSVTKRNIFGGGEVFGVQLKGSYEWNTGNRVSGGNASLNSYELGITTTLSVPKLLFPGFIHKEYEYPTSTNFRLYADMLQRAGFFRLLSFGGNMNYDFQPTPVSKHSITAFRLSYNLLQSTTHEFDSISQRNPALFQSLQNQFIPAIGYTYTYDDIALKRKNHFWWQTSVTQAGNIINGLLAIGGYDYNEVGKKLLNNPFAQFIKGTSEIRYTFNFNQKHAIATRIMSGAVYSYGNARVTPYNEQFFIGGANSIRAFTVRSIGPGRFVPESDSRYAYLDQTGEFKFEANAEYRFKIMGDLHGATFMDTGNVWLLREDEARPDGKLKGSRFFKDLALGTGVGLRYDLDFLVIRLDLGIALHIPYDTGKSGYYNIPKFKDGLGWHLAVGYPF